MHLPDSFRQTTLELFPDTGPGWLGRLPALIAELEERWDFRVGQPFELSFNYVASAIRSDGSEVVFKAGHPHPELTSEMTALEHYQGRGIVRMFEHDPEQGVMLLERLRPGVPLADMEDDEQANRIAAGVMSALWVPAPPDPDGRLCSAVRWARGLSRLSNTFDGGTGPFPSHLVDQAERLFAELLSDPGPQMLLHGDLHHWNILSAARRPWLALDPKGLIGEAEYEVGALIRNRWPENAGKTDLQLQVARRLAIFSEMLGFDRQRMLAWCMAQAVLSAWWSFEDGHRVAAGMILLAEALRDMIG